jgi:hypothetical protein
LPCLDLTEAHDGLVIQYWEYTRWPESVGTHSLEVALDEADPEAAAYTEVKSLTVWADEYWTKHTVVVPPTSSLIGKAKVYFAFRYVGESADDWFLDQIAARPPQAVLEATAQATPNPVMPGTSGVAVTVTLQNVGEGASEALTGTVSTSASGITITSDTASFAPCLPGQVVVASTPFLLDVASDHPVGPLPLTVHLSNGSSVATEIYVGERATAHIVVSLSGATWESDITIRLGVGDPGAPLWRGDNIAGTASSGGTFTYPVDLAAQLAAGYLPPSRSLPWFLEVYQNWDGNFSVTDFTILYNSASYKAAGLPFSVPAFATDYVILPDGPRPIVDGITTVPERVQPGNPGVTLTVRLRNDGAPTEGALSGTLAPSDAATSAAVAGLDTTTPRQFTSAPLGTGQTATNATVWTFDVSSSHTDGKPLNFTLSLTDTVTTWPLAVHVPVPWAGVTVASWSTASATANANWLPDPGETVDLNLVVTNNGDAPTAAQVTGTLSYNTASTAPATVDDGSNTATFGPGPLAPGDMESCSVSYRIHVDASAQAHRTVLLDLALTDGITTWPSTVAVPLFAHLGDDPAGDASSYAKIDLRHAYFHAEGGTLQVHVQGTAPFDAAAMRASLIIADPAGHAMRLRYDAPDLLAYTWSSTTWVETTAPASFEVEPTEGISTSLVFRVTLADLTGLSITNQARLGLQADGFSVTTAYDFLPDAWSGGSLANLISVTW